MSKRALEPSAVAHWRAAIDARWRAIDAEARAAKRQRARDLKLSPPPYPGPLLPELMEHHMAPQMPFHTLRRLGLTCHYFAARWRGWVRVIVSTQRIGWPHDAAECVPRLTQQRLQLFSGLCVLVIEDAPTAAAHYQLDTADALRPLLPRLPRLELVIIPDADENQLAALRGQGIPAAR